MGFELENDLLSFVNVVSPTSSPFVANVLFATTFISLTSYF